MQLTRTIFFFLIAIISTTLVNAQPGFTKGSCVLKDGQQLNGNFNLRTATAQSSAILVYYDRKEEQQFEPSEVKRCTLGRRSYIVGGNFVAPDDKAGIPVDRDFVEVIDTTGGIQLFRYEYEGYLNSSRGGYVIPMSVRAGSLPVMMYGGGAGGYRRTDILLLRAGTKGPLVPYTPGPRIGLFTPAEEKIILVAVGATTAFFADDPELQKRIETGKLSEARLGEAVRAYNAGVRLQLKN
ncbi:hypothetical protein [Hymenobacter sp.]|jgi:hypothetical protein|uniref:hypothetical protein n=1 Tax=Hymenobacter sp. TaxID=1898978 RepID=UPI002EDA5933